MKYVFWFLQVGLILLKVSGQTELDWVWALCPIWGLAVFIVLVFSVWGFHIYFSLYKDAKKQGKTVPEYLKGIRDSIADLNIRIEKLTNKP